MRNEIAIPETAATDAPTDVTLLKQISTGDRDAFDLFVGRMRKLVWSVVYRVLNDAQDTDDVCQEVFLRVWEKSSQFDGTLGKPTTWISTMARNRAIDRIRHKQRRAQLLEGYRQTSTSQDAFDEVDSSRLLDARERGSIVRKAVLGLSSEQRAAIEMVYFNGLTQGEIATQLKQPLGTVKARIRRGLVKLRERVIPELESPAH